MNDFLDLSHFGASEFRRRIEEALSTSAHRGGVYILRAIGPKEVGAPWAGVPRLLGYDDAGALYIGQTSNLATRPVTLLQSLLEEGCRRHDVGRLFALYPRLRLLFPLDRLSMMLVPCADPRRVEARALDDYARQFGEGPPFNTRMR